MNPRQEYERLLRELHAAGCNESVQCDAIREEMDGPWWRMSVEERQAMNKLAARLNGERERKAQI